MKRTLLLLLLPLALCAQSSGPGPAVNYGHVDHPTSTSNPAAQKAFELGMALYYGFNHEEAVRAFQSAQKLDPTMAMAWWGEAIAVGPNYNEDVDAAREEQASKAIEHARVLMIHGSRKERDYTAALATRYTSQQMPNYKALSQAYASAMRRLAAKYPSDDDAQTLYAESLMDLHPWRLWSATGTSNPGTREILAALETVISRNPQHIGANHLYIHAIEASPHPERALASAQRLAGLAPGSGHLVHMPGHIFIRTGDHLQSLLVNEKAVAVDEAYFARTHAQGGYQMYYAHNLHFVAVEAAILGRNKEAIDAAVKIQKLALAHQEMSQMMDPFVEGPALIAVRTRQWDAIRKMNAPPRDLPMSNYMWHYARARAFAASQDLGNARREADAMRECAAAAEKVAINPVADDNSRQIVAIAKTLVDANLSNEPEKRIALLAEAVRLEDTLGYNEPPDWIDPVRETLGGELLRQGSAERAESVFRDELKHNPHSPRSLFGLAESLRAQGKEDGDVRREFDESWRGADAPLTNANAFSALAEGPGQ